jgi:hypothetical protein
MVGTQLRIAYTILMQIRIAGRNSHATAAAARNFIVGESARFLIMPILYPILLSSGGSIFVLRA